MRLWEAIVLAIVLAVFAGDVSAAAQDTEVTVQEGKVKVVTDKGATTVEAGQKAEMKAGEGPMVSVDDPLVKDLVELDGFVQAEKKAGRMRIDDSTVQVYRLDSEETWHVAALMEMSEDLLSSLYSRQTDTVTFGPTTLLGQAAFYDMKGRRLSFDTEKVTDTTALVSLHLKEQIPPGGALKLVIVGDLPAGEMQRSGAKKVIWHEGALWRATAGNDTPYNLNYYQVILPPSAHLVDSNLKPVTVSSMNGRAVLTVRNYTGEEAEGSWQVAFLWVAKDGTSLADLPPEYRGLRDARDVELSKDYRRQMERIRAGLKYSDLSTPLGAVLTWNCALVNNSQEMYDACHYPTSVGDYYVAIKSLPYFLDSVDFLSTPPWPEKPDQGYLHPVYMCYPGTLMRRDMIVCTYRDGKWMRVGNAGDPWETDPSAIGKPK